MRHPTHHAVPPPHRTAPLVTGPLLFLHDFQRGRSHRHWLRRRAEPRRCCVQPVSGAGGRPACWRAGVLARRGAGGASHRGCSADPQRRCIHTMARGAGGCSEQCKRQTGAPAPASLSPTGPCPSSATVLPQGVIMYRGFTLLDMANQVRTTRRSRRRCLALRGRPLDEPPRRAWPCPGGTAGSASPCTSLLLKRSADFALAPPPPAVLWQHARAGQGPPDAYPLRCAACDDLRALTTTAARCTRRARAATPPVRLSSFPATPDQPRRCPRCFAGSRALNFHTISSTLTTQLPHAVGAAYALKVRCALPCCARACPTLWALLHAEGPLRCAVLCCAPACPTLWALLPRRCTAPCCEHAVLCCAPAHCTPWLCSCCGRTSCRVAVATALPSICPPTQPTIPFPSCIPSWTSATRLRWPTSATAPPARETSTRLSTLPPPWEPP